jgi:hypothetical protein
MYQLLKKPYTLAGFEPGISFGYAEIFVSWPRGSALVGFRVSGVQRNDCEYVR